MAKETFIAGILVDDNNDNGKYPRYDATTNSFEMDSPVLRYFAIPDAGNAAGGADTSVWSMTVPANTIDGSKFSGIHINLSAALSATAETTTFKIKLNGVTCSTQATSNTSASLVWYNFITRSTSTTGRSFGSRLTTAAGASADANISITGLDFTIAQTLEVTIASTTASRGILRNVIAQYI